MASISGAKTPADANGNKDRTMRKVILSLFAILILWSPPIHSKEKELVEPVPLFMAPDFEFKQIDSICLAPALDLRLDKTAAFSLSESGPRFNFSRIATADRALAGAFKGQGYGTSGCASVSATLEELRSPSDTWMRSLNFGKSNWLFVVGVESVNSDAAWRLGGNGYAVVSGFLFEKQAGSARLAWRDRALGVFHQGVTGSKQALENGEDHLAVNIGIWRLISKFERRSRGRPAGFVVDYENFDSPCDQVWNVLKDELRSDLKKYGGVRGVFLDETDKMALYTMYHITNPGGHEDHVVLRNHDGKCAMELTQEYETVNDGPTHDWNDLTKQMHATLAK
jgi:hypothetical protein